MSLKREHVWLAGGASAGYMVYRCDEVDALLAAKDAALLALRSQNEQLRMEPTADLYTRHPDGFRCAATGVFFSTRDGEQIVAECRAEMAALAASAPSPPEPADQ